MFKCGVNDMCSWFRGLIIIIIIVCKFTITEHAKFMQKLFLLRKVNVTNNSKGNIDILKFFYTVLQYYFFYLQLLTGKASSFNVLRTAGSESLSVKQET